jgi:hypothetical protein
VEKRPLLARIINPGVPWYMAIICNGIATAAKLVVFE